ncbi:uncharacterized protein LOC142784514 isoform X3 [Rhipicephalus microplus]|uniref:uncharacterized protein LOC142784514 isoform X3 n=1 Tax=Rhipicephalus microplus TaxID=6941 RepID=UPI003F6A8A47
MCNDTRGVREGSLVELAEQIFLEDLAKKCRKMVIKQGKKGKKTLRRRDVARAYQTSLPTASPRPTVQRSSHTMAVASTSHMDPRLGTACLPGGIFHRYMPTLQEGRSHTEKSPLGLCATAG